jgi:hypothetical protein
MALPPCYSIPWHGDGGQSRRTLDGFAVVPLSPGWNYHELPMNLQRVRAYLKKQQLLAGSPGAQGKYDETIHWIDQLSLQWAAFLGQPDPDPVSI